VAAPALDREAVEDLDDLPDDELEAVEAELLDQSTAARTIAELKAEIETLKRLEALALAVRRSGEDRKWRELANLLGEIFTPAVIANRLAEERATYDAGAATQPKPSPSQKLVIFTEHRDTLNYLENRIATLLGRKEAVVCIHGGMGREDRLKAQEAFKFDPDVRVLLATDAAVEQRFGRIHRIGQTEVCHLWNLLAEETREGEVYHALLAKLEEARRALGGQVFDVLGKVEFEGRPLRELILEAVRYGERPEVRARLSQMVARAFDPDKLRDLVDERALTHEAMDAGRVHRIREDMERAEARRLQPHYIESFFLEAFKRLGGTVRQRETRRYEVTHVPGPVRNRDRLIGIGEPVLPRYERVVFEKPLIAPQGQPLAAFVCPGHPLLDATLDLLLEQNRDLLRRGSVLVDETDLGTQPRVLFYLEHAVQDAGLTRSGERRVVSKRLLYVEVAADGQARHLHYAPYLDYRPLRDGEPDAEALMARPECAWISRELEQKTQGYAIAAVVPEHLDEVKSHRLALIAKTEAAVKERLTKEINYWDHRAEDLKAQEQAGKPNAKLNSQEARKRADSLETRLQKRMTELQLEKQLSPLPPVILGGVLVVPAGLLRRMRPEAEPLAVSETPDTQAAAARARGIVMAEERRLGFEPTDREFEKLGYDIESRVPGTGKLRFIEVKGRVSGADTITVTKNEILYSFNKPEAYILAMVEFIDADPPRVYYLRRPFERSGVTTDFNGASVNFPFADLITRAGPPA